MRADHSGDFPVEKTAQRDFLACGFAMSVNDDIPRFTAHFHHRFFDGTKWVIQDRLHERARLDIDDADFPLSGFQDNRSTSRRAIRIVYRTQQTRLGVDERKDLFLVPDMVAGCDH